MSDSDSEVVQPKRRTKTSSDTTASDVADFDNDVSTGSELSAKRRWEDLKLDSDSDSSEALPGFDEETSEPPSGGDQESLIPAPPPFSLPQEVKVMHSGPESNEQLKKITATAGASIEEEESIPHQENRGSCESVVSSSGSPSQEKKKLLEETEDIRPESKPSASQEQACSRSACLSQCESTSEMTSLQRDLLIQPDTAEVMLTVKSESSIVVATSCDKSLQVEDETISTLESQMSKIADLERLVNLMENERTELKNEINVLKNPLHSFETLAAATVATIAIALTTEVRQQEVDVTVENYLLAAVQGRLVSIPPTTAELHLPTKHPQVVLPPEKYQPSDEERDNKRNGDKINDVVMLLNEIMEDEFDNAEQFTDIINKLRQLHLLHNQSGEPIANVEQLQSVNEHSQSVAADFTVQNDITSLLDDSPSTNAVAGISLEEQLARVTLQLQASRESNQFDAGLKSTMVTQVQLNVHKLYELQSELENDNNALKLTIAELQEHHPQEDQTADLRAKITELQNHIESLMRKADFKSSHANLEEDLHRLMIHKKTSAIIKTRKTLRLSRLRENKLMSFFDSLSSVTVFDYSYSSLSEIENRERGTTINAERLLSDEIRERFANSEQQLAELTSIRILSQYEFEVIMDVRRVELLQSEKATLEKEIISLQSTVAETTGKLHQTQMKTQDLEELLITMKEEHESMTERLSQRSKKDFDLLTEENESLTTQLSSLQTIHEEMLVDRTELYELRDQRDHIEGKAMETEKQNKVLRESLETMKEKYDSARGGLHKANSMVERLQSALQTTETQLSETTQVLEGEREESQQEILFLNDRLTKYNKKQFKNVESVQAVQQLKRKVSLLKSTIKTNEIDATSQVSILQEQHERSLSDATSDISKRFEAITQENTDLQQIVKTLTIANKELQTGLTQHQSEARQLSSQVSGLHSDIHTYKTLLSTERSLSEASQAEHLQHISEISVLKEQSSNYSLENKHLATDVTNEKKRSLRLEEELDNLKFTMREMSERKEEIEDVVAGYKTLVSNSNAILQRQVSEREDYPLQLRQELHSSKASNRRLVEENFLFQNSIESLKSELHQVQTCNDNLNSHNKALENVTRGARHREVIDSHQSSHLEKTTARQQLQIKQLSSTRDALEVMVDEYKSLLHSEKDLKREEMIRLTDSLAETRAEVVYLQRTSPQRKALQQLPSLETLRRTDLKLHEKTALCGIIHFAMHGVAAINIDTSRFMKTPTSPYLLPGGQQTDDGMPSLADLALRLDKCMKSYRKSKRKKLDTTNRPQVKKQSG